MERAVVRGIAVFAVMVVLLATGGSVLAQTGGDNFAGAIYTTNPYGEPVNQNIYSSKSDVYLSGGPTKTGGQGLPPGIYYFQVTTPDGALLSSDPAECRQAEVALADPDDPDSGKFVGATGPACKHADGPPDSITGAVPVQLMPYDDTTNTGGEYKVWLIRQKDDEGNTIATVDADGKHITFEQSKTDNYKVLCGALSIVCPGNVTVECDQSSDPSNTGTATYEGGCGSVTRTYEDETSGTCPTIILRTWTVTDTSGQTDTCTQTITVADTTKPEITCPTDVTVECDEEIPPADPTAVVVADNCDPNPKVEFVGDVSDGNSCPETITRTYKATDACGNTATCEQKITVVDTTPPVIVCPEDITHRVAGDQCEWNVNLDVTVTDNCDPDPTVTFTRSDGKDVDDPFPGGQTVVVTVTATDACGNTATCSFTVEVICVPNHTILGTKYYDSNLNGFFDGGEAVIPGFQIHVSYTLPDGMTTSDGETSVETIVSTDENGVWSADVPEGAAFTACEVLPPDNNWEQTGPIPGAFNNDTNTAIADNDKCWTGTMATDAILDLNFGNVCGTWPCEGRTCGFWGNKNGERILSDNDPAWRQLLNDMCLVDGTGASFDMELDSTDPVKPSFKTAYDPFDRWLQKRDAVNMAYQLSAQLSALCLNVQYMGLDPAGKPVLPYSLTKCLGDEVFTVQQIIDKAKAELCLHPTAWAGDSWRVYQGCLETAIDGLNNNSYMFLSDTACPVEYPSE